MVAQLDLAQIITAPLSRLLEEAQSGEQASPRALWCLELAKLHTALAQVAATALNSDSREWVEVAGVKFAG